VVRWMKGERKGDIPDGAMIIKEMFDGNPDPNSPTFEQRTGWAVMLRQKAASKDGWIWGIWFSSTPVPAVFQYGMSFCLSCHASADNKDLAFVQLANIEGPLPATDTWVTNPGRDGGAPITMRNTSPHFGFAQASGAIWSASPPAPSSSQAPMPLDLLFNHVTATAGPDGMNTAQFLTSDACLGCHDGSYLQNNRLPEMMLPDPDPKGKDYVNLSEWSEWNGSLMSQSARDPVFLAQLEAEHVAHPDQGGAIDDFCFSCHAPMGQRQLHADQAGDHFTRDILNDTPDSGGGNAELAKVAALARDGVSCTVCHHITPD